MFNSLMARAIALIIGAGVLSTSAVLLLLYCFIVAGAIPTHNFGATLGWLCGVLLLIVIPVLPINGFYAAIGLITRARLLRAALEKEYRLAALAIVPQEAPPPSLVIGYTRREHIQSKWALTFVPFFFGGLIFFLFPHILTRDWGAAIAWITAGDFTLILALFSYWLIGIGTAKRRQYVRLDDEGLTLERTRRRSQHVSWPELRGFIEIGRSGRDKDGASYWLITATQVLRFDLWGKDTPAYSNVPLWQPASRVILATSLRDIMMTGNQQYHLTIEKDDPATYTARARQLLAAIVTRSGVPLQTANGGASFSAFLARAAKKSLDPTYIVLPADEDEVPLAGPVYQPDDIAIIQSTQVDKPIVLRQRTIANDIRAQVIGFGVIVGIMVLAAILSRANFLTAFINIGIIIIVLFIILRLISRLSRILQPYYPTIVANQEGIAVNYGKGSRHMIPWHRVSDWIILVDPDEEYRIHSYFVDGSPDDDDDYILWFEMDKPALAGVRIKGNRRIAYQKQAALLRAMIAAKTRLPLHAIPIGDAVDDDVNEESQEQAD